MKNKQVKIIIALMVLFAIIIAGALFLNRDAIEAGKEAQRDKTITFTSAGETICVLDQETIKGFPSQEFEATIRSHGMKPEYVVYTGVDIHYVLEAAGIHPAGKDRLHFKGADAYLAAVDADELEKEGRVFIVYEKDGQEMEPKAKGGDGPYQLILLDDSFSQRWCKYLSEIEWEKGK